MSNNLTSDLLIHLKPLTDAGAILYEVGGPVRDRLLGLSPKDHDVLCRGLAMEKIVNILKPYGKVAAVGKSFGVIKYSPHRNPCMEIDIALPRREISTGTGHRDFDVDFDPTLSVEEDLHRRDFTVNAMAISFADGRLIDPFGGEADLKERILRQVFEHTFEEDPLRLLRAVQFAARFNLTIEQTTLEAMKKHASLIETVSGERISMELCKLMRAHKPSSGFMIMNETGILKKVIPELSALKGIEQDKQPGDDVFMHTMRVLDATRSDREIEHRGDISLMFAALFHDIGKSGTSMYHAPSKRIVFFGHQLASKRLARRIMKRLKLAGTGVNEDEVLKLIEHHMFETKASFTERAIRRFIAKVGKDLIFKLMDLRLADNRGGKHPTGIKGVMRLKSKITGELSKKPPFGPKDLAINGNDLIEMGLPEGPLIGQILKSLVELALDEPSLNTKEDLIAKVKELMDNENRREK